MNTTEVRPVSSLQWTDALEMAALEAMHDNGDLLFPSGVNESFNRALIHQKFEAATGLRVEGQVLWDWINEQFDMRRLENVLGCHFPNKLTETRNSDNMIFQSIMRLAERRAGGKGVFEEGFNESDEDDIMAEYPNSDSGFAGSDDSVLSVPPPEPAEEEEETASSKGLQQRSPPPQSMLCFESMLDSDDEGPALTASGESIGGN